MEIRIRETGAVMFESEYRVYLKANNGPSYDVLTHDVAESLGVDVMLEGPQASPTRYQTAYRDGVEQIGGAWFTKYSVSDMDADAITAKDAEQAKSMREQRNTKLSDCDWTQLADSTADKAAWATYRQALRDLTKQSGFPWEVTWPDAP
jgi:Phage tail assembly chaperone protein